MTELEKKLEEDYLRTDRIARIVVLSYWIFVLGLSSVIGILGYIKWNWIYDTSVKRKEKTDNTEYWTSEWD